MGIVHWICSLLALFLAGIGISHIFLVLVLGRKMNETAGQGGIRHI
jgi:hypothetical protein